MAHTHTHHELSARCRDMVPLPAVRPIEGYLYYSSNREALRSLVAEHAPHALDHVGADHQVTQALLSGDADARVRARFSSTYVILDPNNHNRERAVPVGMVAIKPVASTFSRWKRANAGSLISSWVDTDRLDLSGQQLTLPGFAFNVLSLTVEIARGEGAATLYMLDRLSQIPAPEQTSLVGLNQDVIDPQDLEFAPMGFGRMVVDGQRCFGERWVRHIGSNRQTKN